MEKKPGWKRSQEALKEERRTSIDHLVDRGVIKWEEVFLTMFPENPEALFFGIEIVAFETPSGTIDFHASDLILPLIEWLAESSRPDRLLWLSRALMVSKYYEIGYDLTEIVQERIFDELEESSEETVFLTVVDFLEDCYWEGKLGESFGDYSSYVVGCSHDVFDLAVGFVLRRSPERAAQILERYKECLDWGFNSYLGDIVARRFVEAMGTAVVEELVEYAEGYNPWCRRIDPGIGCETKVDAGVVEAIVSLGDDVVPIVEKHLLKWDGLNIGAVEILRRVGRKGHDALASFLMKEFDRIDTKDTSEWIRMLHEEDYPDMPFLILVMAINLLSDLEWKDVEDWLAEQPCGVTTDAIARALRMDNLSIQRGALYFLDHYPGLFESDGIEDAIIYALTKGHLIDSEWHEMVRENPAFSNFSRVQKLLEQTERR